MKQLKRVAYQVRHNARNRYNLTSIILFMYNLIIYCINSLLIAIKFSNKKRGLKLITVNEKLYTIPLYMYIISLCTPCAAVCLHCSNKYTFFIDESMAVQIIFLGFIVWN